MSASMASEASKMSGSLASDPTLLTSPAPMPEGKTTESGATVDLVNSFIVGDPEAKTHLQEYGTAAVRSGTSDQAFAGTKVCFLVVGSRGDCQPYVPFARGLITAGADVLYLCNEDHVDFVESFGIRAQGTFKPLGMEHPDFVKAMTDGSAAAFFGAMNSKDKRDFPEEIRKTWPVLEEFAPDVIILSPLKLGFGLTYGMSHRVPIVLNVLQLVTETAEYPPMGAENDSSTDNLVLWAAFKRLYFEGQLKLLNVIEETLQQDFSAERKTFHGLFATGGFSHGKTPNLMLAGVSPSFVSLPKDVHVNENIVFTGWMTLTSEEQQAVGRRNGKGSSYFGEDRFPSLTAFLAAGEPPVYLGWGSMIAVSPEHMARIAVEALMMTKKRGIILGGFAKLNEEMLNGAPNAKELIDYVQKGNVFFTNTAPHEWLFPQCSVIVHHGGSGTLAASVRSGNPTIITPIFLDQMDHARLVNTAGIGVGTQQFQKVRVSELAAAIEACMQPDTRARAKEMGVKVLQENGVEVAVAELAKFMETKVRTGEFFKVWDALADQPANEQF